VLGDALRKPKQGARLSLPQGRCGAFGFGDKAMKQHMPIPRSLGGPPAI
jgi:hypothetical protein